MHIGASVGIENSFASVNFSLPRNEAIGGATRAQQGPSGDSLRREPHPVRSIVSDQAMPQSGEPSVRDRHLSVAAKCCCVVAASPSARALPAIRMTVPHGVAHVLRASESRAAAGVREIVKRRHGA